MEWASRPAVFWGGVVLQVWIRWTRDRVPGCALARSHLQHPKHGQIQISYKRQLHTPGEDFPSQWLLRAVPENSRTRHIPGDFAVPSDICFVWIVMCHHNLSVRVGTSTCIALSFQITAFAFSTFHCYFSCLGLAKLMCVERDCLSQPRACRDGGGQMSLNAPFISFIKAPQRTRADINLSATPFVSEVHSRIENTGADIPSPTKYNPQLLPKHIPTPSMHGYGSADRFRDEFEAGRIRW